MEVDQVNVAREDVDRWLIGVTLLNWVTTVDQLGHGAPGATLDYVTSMKMTGEQTAAPLIVRDFVAWTAGRLDMVPDGARERLVRVAHRLELPGHGWGI